MRNKLQTKAHRFLIGAVLTAFFIGSAWGEGPNSAPGKGDILRASEDLNLGLENHLQYTDKLMAWATPDSIRFALVSWICPVSLCASCSLIRHQLPGIPLPGSHLVAPPVFALTTRALYLSKDDAAEAMVVVAMPNGRLYRYQAAWPTLNSSAPSLEADSISMDLKPGQVPSMMALEANPWDMLDRILFIGGPNGLFLISSLPRGRAMGKPLPPDMPSREGYVAYGGGEFAGAQGSVMEWQYDIPPKIMTTGIPTAIRAVDHGGAMADAGWVAVREGSKWTAFKLTPGEFRDFEIVRNARGLGILRYPKTGEPQYTLLRETPSRLVRFKWNGIDYPNLPDMVSVGAGSGLPIEVSVADSEGNYMPPVVDLISGRDTVHLAQAFTGSLPEGGCAGQGLCVQDGAEALKFSLGRESIVFAMTVKASSFAGLPAGCAPVSRRDSLFTVSHGWKEWDRIEIREGVDRLSFFYQGPDAVRAGSQVKAGTAGSGSAVRDAAGRATKVAISGGKRELMAGTYRLR